MLNVLFVSNEAKMTRYYTQNEVEKFQRKLRIHSWFMSYHRADGSHLVHHIPNLNKHFSDVYHSYRLQNIDMV